MASDDDCRHCALDRVEWFDVPSCTCASVHGLVADIARGRDLYECLFVHDRILYVLGIVLLLAVVYALWRKTDRAYACASALPPVLPHATPSAFVRG